MKSQVNALLHVLEGLRKDASLAYPALKGGLSKDIERIALYCQTRGIGLFTLDLPSLESCLLAGLESGRLVLSGPLSHKRSRGASVPRLFSGLWLRVFDKDACLKQDVDVTALAFLRQFLVLGKKLELGCTYERTKAIVRAYHDIEHYLRHPSLSWGDDRLRDDRRSANRCHSGSDERTLHAGFPRGLSQEGSQEGEARRKPELASSVEDVATSGLRREGVEVSFDHLHFVQANDGCEGSLPLFQYRRLQFPAVEDRGSGSESFSGDSLSLHERRDRLEDQHLLYKVQQVADLIVGSFDTLNPSLYSESRERSGKGLGFKHGPGAVAERLKGWDKSSFPSWPHKLDHIFPYGTCGRTSLSPLERPSSHEVASRLIAVPKTSKGPRLIAAEPVAHQWCQQLVLAFLFEQCQKHFGADFIDFRDQSKSGDLVIKSSLDRSLATVDLSDASDRLTCWTVERVFRSNPSILRALHAARTRYLRDDILGVPTFVKLRKFASQGTAVTFPVMSITMLCIALAACLGDEEWTTPSQGWAIIRKYRNQVRVFGDDIVIPSRGYARLVRLMEILQLKVNVAKSYVNGQYRESCGTDGYAGYDITPVKPKTLVADRPASCQAVVDISNNLFLKGYWYASHNCSDLLPVRLRRNIRIVGPSGAGFRGLASYSGSDESHLTQRWNSRLHRYEVRAWGILPQVQERPRDGHTVFLDFVSRKYSHEHARTVSTYTDVRKTRDGLRWEPQNIDARQHVRPSQAA